MRNLKGALAAGIIALTPLTVSSAIITEPYSLTIPLTQVFGMQNFNPTPIAQFNPANGTLNDITATLTGPGTLALGSANVVNASLLTFFGVNLPGATQNFNSSGPINFNLSGTDSSASDFTGLIGTGTTALVLFLFTPQGSGTIEAGLQGDITYDYTPAPEPASLALLGVGLASLGMIRRAAGFRISSA
jgi:hypothetical protein